MTLLQKREVCRSRSLTLFLLSWWEALFWTREFPLGTLKCRPREWDDTGKMKLFFLPLVCVVVLRRYFVPLCCWSFFSGLPSSPRAIFVHRSLFNCWSLLGGGWKLESPTQLWWWLHLLSHSFLVAFFFLGLITLTPTTKMATHSSILAWRIPWTEEPGGLQSTGSQRVRHDWATSLSKLKKGESE